jgi:hypothetical protein
MAVGHIKSIVRHSIHMQRSLAVIHPAEICILRPFPDAELEPPLVIHAPPLERHPHLAVVQFKRLLESHLPWHSSSEKALHTTNLLPKNLFQPG